MQEITKAILAIQQNFDRIVYVTSGEMPDIDVLLTKTKSLGIYLPAGQEYDKCAKLIDKQAFGQSVQLNSQYLIQAHSDKCFYQGSITKYSSVLKPAHIKKLIPGLTFNERHDVTGITVEQLLSTESLGKNDTALLVLDINGAETELKHVLVTLVKVFDSLVIKTAPQSLFGETPAPMNTLSNHLKELDLVPIVLPEMSPPYVNLIVNNAKPHGLTEITKNNKKQQKRASKLEVQIKQLLEKLSVVENKNHLLSEQHANAEVHNKTLKQQIDNLAQQASSEKEAVGGAQQELIEQAKRLISKLEQQLNDTNNKLVEQQENENTIKQRLATVNKSLLENQGKFEKLKHQFGDVASQKAEFEQQLNNITKELTEQTHWRLENKKWAEGLQKQLHDKSNSFEQLQSQFNDSSSLSSKMMLKAQLDLDSLRSKYQHKVDSERQLLALVKQLREKLEMAANYYFRLQKDYPELVEKDVPDSVGHK